MILPQNQLNLQAIHRTNKSQLHLAKVEKKEQGINLQTMSNWSQKICQRLSLSS